MFSQRFSSRFSTGFQPVFNRIHGFRPSLALGLPTLALPTANTALRIPITTVLLYRSPRFPILIGRRPGAELYPCCQRIQTGECEIKAPRHTAHPYANSLHPRSPYQCWVWAPLWACDGCRPHPVDRGLFFRTRRSANQADNVYDDSNPFLDRGTCL